LTGVVVEMHLGEAATGHDRRPSLAPREEK